MSFPRYPKYKASGVEWLGEVPEGWEVFQLRRIVAEHRQGYYSTDPYVETGVKLLRITDLGESGAVNYDTCPRVEDRSDVGEFLLRNGDFVFARTGGAGSFGLIGEISERIAYASYLIRFRFCKNSLPGFLRFFFLSAGFKGGIQRDIHGGVNQNVHAQDIKNQCFAIPPLAEQTAIAAFLDRETAKIDGLVAEQKRLMELLKEKRQAVISHAVTKGLDPHAKMKPSGIEWLGEVPEHWAVLKLKFLCKVQTGDKDTENAVEGGQYPFFVRSQTVERINSMAFDCEAVLTAGDGVGVGKVFHYHKGPFDFHQRVYMMSDFQKVSGPFFFHFLRENFFKVALEGGAKSTVDSLRRPMFMNFPVCVPSLSEQSDIVNLIESESSKFDALTAVAQRAIDLLQERRTALISAAVTGQIDVRNQPSKGKP
jgi:type I restriction enzyme S subunit